MDTRTDREKILEVREPCCTTWEMAHSSGTDNEGYMSLVRRDGGIGYDFPPPKFCPWCGAEKGSPSALERAFTAEPQASIVNDAMKKLGEN